MHTNLFVLFKLNIKIFFSNFYALGKNNISIHNTFKLDLFQVPTTIHMHVHINDVYRSSLFT
jgi:hypothetical protein